MHLKKTAQTSYGSKLCIPWGLLTFYLLQEFNLTLWKCTCHCRNVLVIVEMLTAGMPLPGAHPAAPILSHSVDINYYHYPGGVHIPTGSPVFPSELQTMFSIV